MGFRATFHTTGGDSNDKSFKKLVSSAIQLANYKAAILSVPLHKVPPPKKLMKSPLRSRAVWKQHRVEPKIVHSSEVTYCLLFGNHQVTIASEQPCSPLLPISPQTGMFTHQIRFRTLNAGKITGSLQIALPEVHFKYPSCRSICAEAKWYSRASRSSHCSRC